MMTDGDSLWLLSCKHGMAYQLGASSVEELASAMHLAGARKKVEDALASGADDEN